MIEAAACLAALFLYAWWEKTQEDKHREAWHRYKRRKRMHQWPMFSELRYIENIAALADHIQMVGLTMEEAAVLIQRAVKTGIKVVRDPQGRI